MSPASAYKLAFVKIEINSCTSLKYDVIDYDLCALEFVWPISKPHSMCTHVTGQIQAVILLIQSVILLSCH